MLDQVKQPKVKLAKAAWWWFGVLAILMLSTWLLGHFDNATELTPNHTDVHKYCFWFSGAIAITSAIVGFSQSSGRILIRMFSSILVFGLLGGLASLLFANTAANIILNRRDFPPGEKQTYWALLPIERAYRSDSRTGASWIIQPGPIWSNIHIAHEDYRLMLERSMATGGGDEPSSLSSRSYFCAKVLMQRSGEALRVLHAGQQTLPPATVGVCSEMTEKEPALPILR